MSNTFWDSPQERHERGLEAFYERHPFAEESVFVGAANFESALDELDARLGQ